MQTLYFIISLWLAHSPLSRGVSVAHLLRFTKCWMMTQYTCWSRDAILTLNVPTATLHLSADTTLNLESTLYIIYIIDIYIFIQFNYSKFNKICLTIGFMRPVVSLKSSEALRKTKTPTLFYILGKTPSTICVSFPPLPRCHLTPSLLSRRSPWLTLTQDEIWRTRGTGDTAMLRALSALGWQLTRIKRRNNPLLSISSPQ